ncbi:MAG: hypothetical protein LBH81_02070 [Rickettsiales bacterium]|jgi:hypothetical protein|nr:hypothetical protein [Rickettsiales bacterium]
MTSFYPKKSFAVPDERTATKAVLTPASAPSSPKPAAAAPAPSPKLSSAAEAILADALGQLQLAEPSADIQAVSAEAVRLSATEESWQKTLGILSGSDKNYKSMIKNSAVCAQNIKADLNAVNSLSLWIQKLNSGRLA